MEDLIRLYEQKREPVKQKLAKRHTATTRDAKETGTIHGTWQFENRMLSYIRDGEVEKLQAFLRETAANHLQEQAGTLASDPLRQAKNLLIGLTALVGKVAGIGGGMDVEDAYRLIDLYTQECERTSTIEAVYLLQYNMVMDFTERVRQAKLPEHLSREVFSAVQFIADHAHESVGIDEVAEHVGMSRSALTRRFKEETGTTVNGHIVRTKVRDAKRLLRYSDLSYGEIANMLAFSSQAYFQTVFKRETGMTPGAYRKMHQPEQ